MSDEAAYFESIRKARHPFQVAAARDDWPPSDYVAVMARLVPHDFKWGWLLTRDRAASLGRDLLAASTTPDPEEPS